jgi:pyridoxine/pyridoxamine 5'-phosphate oxidase
MTDPAPRRRSLLQFSLRTLFWLMLLVAAFFGGRESMRPALQAERVKAERERYTALLRQVDAELAAAAARQSEAEAQRAALLESAASFYRAAAEQEVKDRPGNDDGGNE